jgi:alpha-L-rhamnosidase
MRYIMLVLMLMTSCHDKSSNYTIMHLKCEHLTDPLGIDSKTPRFSWQQQSEDMGSAQTSYQIKVWDNSQAAKESLIWDSGRQKSGRNLVVYAGEALQPFTKYYWQVSLLDNQGTARRIRSSHF